MAHCPVRVLTFCALLALSLNSCSERATETTPAPEISETEASSVENTSPSAEIEARLHEHIAVLASDEFGGRAPATPGEELTINYLRDQFAAMGIGPGNGDSYFQPVDVTEITATGGPVLNIQGSDYEASFTYIDQQVVGSPQQIPFVTVQGSEMVFVGYGIVAPERGWNDYAGIDVTDKTVVILVNDAGYATQDPELFNGNAMTYYGRWTYKYEEAARQGAAAAIIVHETGPAGYGWEVVGNSWTGPQIGLTSPILNGDRSEIEGWITLETAEEIFDGAGLDYQEMKAAAMQPGFRPVPMSDLRLNVSIENSVRTSLSQNVVAAIPGTTRPEETIIYTAHWDHLGELPSFLDRDNIYNGAADNASGTAGLLELARLHSQLPPPERTIVFLAVTAEESGLLGSQWYAENPIYPIAKTVANINIDGLNTFGRTRDVVVVGARSSELEDYLETAAASQDRYLVNEPTPERGYYYRSDHFNFAKVGVPALYADSGEDNREFGREYGAAMAQDYIDFRYHGPGDEYNPDWDLSGAVEDLMLYFEIASRLANQSTWPEWYEGNEFKAIRDITADQRL
ncbi:MAG: M28 family peptidase [Pseudomonadales bacterium]|nr:M28 family peptidase [Pseudomonadales bacterium]